MKAVILCGGLGTRIRDASEVLPKPMLPIGQKPILWHILKSYAAHGITDFVLCLGYKGWAIKEFFLNYHAMSSDIVVTLGRPSSVKVLDGAESEGWTVTLAETGETAQTGARVAAVRRFVEGDEPFCLTYGDGVSDVDITELLAFHGRSGKIATVTAVRPPGRFGEIVVKSSLVQEFNEKPQATSGRINGGFFVFDGRRIWDYLSADPASILEREPLQRLSAEGQLAAFEHSGFWQPMDTLREYQYLNKLWSEGQAPWNTWDRRSAANHQ